MIITGLIGPEQTLGFYVPRALICIYFLGHKPSDSLFFPLFEVLAPIYVL
jgi:hypothetical protein